MGGRAGGGGRSGGGASQSTATENARGVNTEKRTRMLAKQIRKDVPKFYHENYDATVRNAFSPSNIARSREIIDDEIILERQMRMLIRDIRPKGRSKLTPDELAINREKAQTRLESKKYVLQLYRLRSLAQGGGLINPELYIDGNKISRTR